MTAALAVRRGVGRVVLLVGPFAIKAPRVASHGDGAAGVAASIARGLAGNLSERQWAGSSPGFAPLLLSLGGVVNVYRRADPVPASFDDYDAIDAPSVVGDRKPANVGVLDGKPVWVDYDTSWNGCPHAAWNERP